MFSKDFTWGVATSAYQIEGTTPSEGRGTHIWDVFCAEPNKVFDNHSGQTACNHYQRYKDDIQIMRKLGVKAYRFSVDWTRILPNGTGKIKEEGIRFYSNLIDELLENNIEPYLTLFHWEYPYELYKKGGWLNEESANWFAEYAKIIVQNYSDRVTKFITLNEPQCFLGLSYLRGEHAPGLKLPLRDTFQMAHNILKAHGKAVKTLREYAKQTIQVGIAPTCGMTIPCTEKEEDVDAARKALFAMNEDLFNWTWNVSWFSDPIFLGHYPEDGLVQYKKYLPEITEEDMKLIAQPLDFMGENIYNGGLVKATGNGGFERVSREPGYVRTANNWPVTPECLYWGPKFLYERYQVPIYITENGFCCHDVVSGDGKVHDSNRIEFTNRYLQSLKRAVEEGVDVRGYFHWSLLDNFEWSKGYQDRFGLVHVDFKTQKRIIKDSGYWYRKVIESNGENLEDTLHEGLYDGI